MAMQGCESLIAAVIVAIGENFEATVLTMAALREETLRRYPQMELAGPTRVSVSPFTSQLTTLPVTLGSRAGRPADA